MEGREGCTLIDPWDNLYMKHLNPDTLGAGGPVLVNAIGVLFIDVMNC